MATKKLSLDPDVVLEWLLDRGFVEETSSPSMPYRIAINEEDNLPYPMTYLTKKLSERFGNTKMSSTHRKCWNRELVKCFDENLIKYDDRGTRGNMHWEFEMTVRKWLEQKLGIDLEIVDEYDRNHKSNSDRGGKRWQSYWRGISRKYSEEDALRFFKDYFDRRMNDPSKNLKVGRKAKRLIIAQKQPSNDVKEIDLNRPTSDKNNVLERLETSLDVSRPVVAIPEKIAEN